MTLECKIPRDRSALGMMAHNAMNHGDDFRNDGYVYDAEGIRIRKWFSGLGDRSHAKYFWHPCLKNISKIESLLHRLSTRQVQTWSRLELLFKQIQSQSESTKRYGSDTWIVHAKPTHKFQSFENKDYWVFYLYNRQLGGYNGRGAEGFSYSSDWVVEPEIKSLPDLGQQFYDLSHYHMNCCSRMGLLRAMLFEAISKDIDQKHGLYGDKCRVFQYTINSRPYWLHEVANCHGVPVLEWMPVQNGLITESIQ
jgi:hypothetical protein